jgi:ParB-like chromosome segregation protein Spo0J
MPIQDRVKELRRVRAGDLAPHPRNWRTHPERQRAALAGVLAEVGYADALLARELPDGSLQLIDGHLRAEVTPDEVVPVLIVDLDDVEAEKVLLTHDPLAGLAGVHQENLTELLRSVETSSEEVHNMFENLAADNQIVLPETLKALPDLDLPQTFK